MMTMTVRVLMRARNHSCAGHDEVTPSLNLDVVWRMQDPWAELGCWWRIYLVQRGALCQWQASSEARRRLHLEETMMDCRRASSRPETSFRQAPNSSVESPHTTTYHWKAHVGEREAMLMAPVMQHGWPYESESDSKARLPPRPLDH